MQTKTDRNTDWEGLFIGGLAIGAGILLLNRSKASAPPGPGPTPPPGKANLYGQVTSGGNPVQDALITVRSITRAVSDGSGNYIVTDLEPGEAAVFCSAAGYIATPTVVLDLIAGENNRYDFILTPEEQPTLLLSNLQIIPPDNIWPGRQVNIVATANSNINYTYSVSLKVNGMVVHTKNVSVLPGEPKLVEFAYTPAVAGIYQVELDGLSGQFEAEELPAVMYLESLQISPTSPMVGSQVQISAIGTTDVSGTYPASLKINGAIVQTKDVPITAGEAKLITFAYTPAVVGVYQVELTPAHYLGHYLTGQFEAVSGLLCYNCGQAFATQAQLDAHITSTHSAGFAGWAPCQIKKISWGDNVLTSPGWGQRLVAAGMYLLDKAKPPQPYGPVAITFETFDLWHLFGPSDYPQVEVRANVFVGKFGDIGDSPFRTTVGSSGAPILYLTSGGTVQTPIGDSRKTFTMVTSAGLGPLPPGLYDIMVFVSMYPASIPGFPVGVGVSTYGYVILDAWRVP